MRIAMLIVFCAIFCASSQDAWPVSNKAIDKAVAQSEAQAPTTSSDAFKAFAMANHGIGSFHTAIGTMSLVFTAATLTTVFVSASRSSWEGWHTSLLINGLGGVVISTWEITAGVKLRRAAGQYVFPKKLPLVEY